MKKLFSLLFFIVSLMAAGQGIDQDKVNFVHSFANNIQWPTDKDEYLIKVITQDRSLSAAFRDMAENRQINGKPVKVSFSSYVTIPENIEILYVSSQYNGALQTIIDRITGKPVLIITEDSPDQQYVMINLLGPSFQSFEFNRANITNQNLRIGGGFNGLGGSEINVAALYRQTRDAARELEERSKNAKEQIEEMNVQTSVAFKIIRDQERQITEGEEQILRQNQTLDSLAASLQVREQQLNDLLEEISVQNDSLAAGVEKLAKQNREIELINNEIEKKEDELSEMNLIVSSQATMLYFFIAFAVFLVVALILAYRAYQARKRDARKLNEQKEELKDLLDELKSTQTQLIQSEKMASLGTLTAGIAHEINNAINYVYSGIHVLNNKFSEMKPLMGHIKELDENDDDLKTKVKEVIEQKNQIEYDSYETVMDTMINSIQVGAERTISVVKGLRTFSRGQEESMDEIDIHEDIELSLVLLKNKIRPTLSIKKKLAEELPKMYGYPGQVGQAILNIMGNAMDACGNQPDSIVLIKTSVEGEKVLITIRDNGTGISKEDLDKIFDPFYTTKKIGEGSGLGLSITYGIIEKHNGKIDVNSVLGKGTEFKIELPLNNQPLN